ncbi:DUF6069 family protein [Microbacterium sp.]|uniref:DUF6069 family protein n=1 Tax=Microbacterium sp. TaxID=51671 RepID=UPI0039E679FD
MTARAIDPSPVSSRPFGLGRLLLLALIASALNLAVFGVALTAGVPMKVGDNPIDPMVPPIATFVPMVVAGLLVWLVARRWTQIGRRRAVNRG